jgi:hypothetical protein
MASGLGGAAQHAENVGRPQEVHRRAPRVGGGEAQSVSHPRHAEQRPLGVGVASRMVAQSRRHRELVPRMDDESALPAGHLGE